jgi:hypothetical protein
MCHCLECQRRTGAVISNQARFRREQITFEGRAPASSCGKSSGIEMAARRTASTREAMEYGFCSQPSGIAGWARSTEC